MSVLINAFFLQDAAALIPVGQVVYESDTPGSPSYTVEAGITLVDIEIWGGGGGGAGAVIILSGGFGATLNISGGRGGAGGGYSFKQVSVSPGDVITSTIGVAGALGTFNHNGGDGGQSLASTGAHNLVANGGQGGRSSGPSGGTASGGSTNTTGSTSSGTHGGGAGNGGGGTTEANQVGTTPGGGGEGGDEVEPGFPSTGAAGAPGRFRVTKRG